MTETTQFSNFLVETQEIPNPLCGSIKRTQLIFKRLLDEQIIKTLGDLLDSDDEIYNDPVKISPDDLYPHLRTIQSKIENSGDFSLIELFLVSNLIDCKIFKRYKLSALLLN